MKKRVVRVLLSEITYNRFAELAEQMGLEVSEAAAETLRERVFAGRKQLAAGQTLPEIEAQTFARCVEALSVLTEPDSISRVFEYLGRSVMAQAQARKREIDIETRALLAGRTQFWLGKMQAGDMVGVPPLSEAELEQ